MKLSELLLKTGFIFTIKVDSEFKYLGMATSQFNDFGVLSFLADSKYFNDVINNRNISSVITTDEIYQSNISFPSHLGIIIADNPKQLFYNVHNFLSSSDFYWKHFPTEIDPSSVISKNAIISGNSVKIGQNCTIEDNVVINEGVQIGDNTIIRSGTIIGSNGFQFLNTGVVVTQVTSSGKVVIGNNVEIQHNCCVDRGVLGGNTIVHDWVKVDNFVHLAHDCVIGDRTLITAGVKFGGRTVVGKDCWIGINATISNGLVIGDGATVSLGSVVTRNVNPGDTVTGNFAIDHVKFLQNLKNIR
ncbi:MAG: UDP-3-O-(3-hydroxymyristoyl)glucosamine N-acyltransferase [Acholeplasma sp.]|nr:UDP-3-O-(3-hydroxymyristoyl)glucosamine N-acyltransferase [Acholeplasma sp.]